MLLFLVLLTSGCATSGLCCLLLSLHFSHYFLPLHPAAPSFLVNIPSVKQAQSVQLNIAIYGSKNSAQQRKVSGTTLLLLQFRVQFQTEQTSCKEWKFLLYGTHGYSWREYERARNASIFTGIDRPWSRLPLPPCLLRLAETRLQPNRAQCSGAVCTGAHWCPVVTGRWAGSLPSNRPFLQKGREKEAEHW